MVRSVCQKTRLDVITLPVFLRLFLTMALSLKAANLKFGEFLGMLTAISPQAYLLLEEGVRSANSDVPLQLCALIDNTQSTC